MSGDERPKTDFEIRLAAKMRELWLSKGSEEGLRALNNYVNQLRFDHGCSYLEVYTVVLEALPEEGVDMAVFDGVMEELDRLSSS